MFERFTYCEEKVLNCHPLTQGGFANLKVAREKKLSFIIFTFEFCPDLFSFSWSSVLPSLYMCPNQGGSMDFILYKGKHGGRRPEAGRKRIHSRGVSHRIREKVSGRTPLHINFKFRTFIKNKRCLALLKRAILNARSHGLRVIHFSLQSNHIHLIVEAFKTRDTASLIIFSDERLLALRVSLRILCF